MTMTAPYIGLWPAIRLIVAEKLPGGPEQAAQMTDGVIRASAWDQSSPVLESFRAAARALKDAVLDTSVHMTGVAPAGRRQIEDFERGNHWLDLRGNVFAGQPPFLAPEFCVPDLRRVVARVAEPVLPAGMGGNVHKRQSVHAEIKRLGIAALVAMSQKERELKIIEAVKELHGEDVSDRYVRELYAEAKERS
jgi:hypothetical protein